MGHDDELGPCGFARGVYGGADFVHVAEGFEHQAIDAGFHQSIDLLAKYRPSFFEAGGTERFEANT